MPSYISMAAAFVALLQFSAASPVDLLEKRKTFSIQQVEKGKVAKVGALEVAKTYRKFNVELPDTVKAAAASASGSVTAVPEDAFDSLYLSPVTVGCQTVELDFDTGSADLWVFSSLQPSSQTSGHSVYNPTSCSTSKLLSGQSWDIEYGDGSSAGGRVYADTVVVGGVTATSQAVEAATSVSSEFLDDTDDDGILGLSFSTLNTVSPTQQKTFFDNVKSSLASPLFAVTLKKGAAGTYDFGFIDDSKYTGDITYTNVNTANGFWEITASGYAIGSGSTVSTSIDAIADTGTTLVYLPSAVAKAYWAKVSGSSLSNSLGGYVFPCSAASSLPDLSIVIGGVKQTIPGSYINYAPATSTSCFGGIQPNTGIGFSILGDIFLKSKFVVFENSGSTPRLGIAQQAGVTA